MLSQNNHSSVIYGVGEEYKLKKLILAAKKGDTQAFEEIYSMLYTPLYRYVYSRTNDIELVNDICQQTFLNFYQALAKYEPKKSPLAYLFTIAKRLLINNSEKKTFSSFDETLFETYKDETIDIEEECDLTLTISKINDYISLLSQDEQDLIRLYFYSELSYKEISEILEKEEAYLRKLKERALKKLIILTKHLHERT